jgi:Uncharacterized protein conserved in bacteria
MDAEASRGRRQIKLFEPITQENSGKFVGPVDLVRVVAIFLVVFLHVTNTFYDQIYLGTVSTTAWWTFVAYKSLSLVCVPLFVILTGALLLQPSKIHEPIKVFLKKRLNRLGLAFLFWTFVYLAWGFFISKMPLTLYNVLQGTVISLTTGAYYHFWYIYLIAGLYIITPLLRAAIAYRDEKLVRYLILIWFIGICIVPLLPLFTDYSVNGEIFIMGGYTGYFLIGAYLQRAQLRKRYMYSFLIVGLIFTLICTWIMTYPLEPLNNVYYFFDYLAVNVVVMSIGAYALLLTFPSNWPGDKHPYASKLVKAISNNTLPIFLGHVIVLETLSRGLLGFTMDLSVFPIIEVPVASVAILLITLGLVLLMKKVPVLRKLIG